MLSQNSDNDTSIISITISKNATRRFQDLLVEVLQNAGCTLTSIVEHRDKSAGLLVRNVFDLMIDAT